jgi:hypothetical protein
MNRLDGSESSGFDAGLRGTSVSRASDYLIGFRYPTTKRHNERRNSGGLGERLILAPLLSLSSQIIDEITHMPDHLLAPF